MDYDNGGYFLSDSDDSSASAAAEERLLNALQSIKENDPLTTKLEAWGGGDYVQDMTDEEWEELGNIIANNTHLTNVELYDDALSDHKASFLFRGLTRSSSIKDIWLKNNELTSAGVRSMVPFLQNANNLEILSLNYNNLQSEGFHLLLRVLRDSPIEDLDCGRCGIQSISINIEHIPRNLKRLHLGGNNIDADGCRELVKLLQGEDATITDLDLGNNNIDDDGIDILVDALRNNTPLKELSLQNNRGLSIQGKIKLLKLVNDVSSIDATLRSNHTLKHLWVGEIEDKQIQVLIDNAIRINRNAGSPEAAGREKVIWTQLDSDPRAELAELQGVHHSAYSEIDPLHLPEVLALVDEYHGQSDLYVALKDSIAGLMSTVNRKAYIRQQIAYHEEQLKELSTELAAIEEAEGVVGDGGGRNKRHRAC